MRADWVRACREAGLSPVDDAVMVPLGHEGRHCISVAEEGGEIRLTGVVLRASETGDIGDLVERVLDRNRSVRLLGYRVDDRGRLVGEARLPAAGLEADELVFRLKLLAADCNRFEYVLAGRDEE